MDTLPEELVFEVKDSVGTLTLNRPDKRNALTTSMYEGMRRVFEIVKKSDETKVLIITGNGAGFCAGSDAENRLLAHITGERYTKALEETRADLLEPVMLYFAAALYKLGKPTIAAVNGVAAGAGLSLALLCDIRVASEKARFAASWLNVGLTPDVGATFTLPRIIGMEKALKFFVTADTIDAKEAERINMVSQVVPHDDLMKVSRELAINIAKGPSVAIELTKRAVAQSLTSELEAQLYFENYAQNICFMTNDFREGVRAFQQKRRAEFKGL
jgi:2-(1,2-epoxy-1,2-dihydrophenyl)acetyl-CoA isomerase